MTYTQTVIETVSARRGVAVREVLSPMRNRPVAWARQEAQHILRATTHKSLPEIGREFGRDHTSVIHGLGAVAARMENDAYRGEIAEMIREVRKKTGAFTSRSRDQKVVFKSVRNSLPEQ